MRRAVVLVLAACSTSNHATGDGRGGSNADAAVADAAACTTRITYGSAWMHPANHPGQDDVVADDVTWDGSCIDDGGNSYALLSNGFQPSFAGNGACELALDYAASCADAGACTTRVSYGTAWLPPPDHPAPYDDLPNRVFATSACTAAGSDSFEALSNGFQPYFAGAASCALSFRWDNCGGLYANPVIPTDCPDPGVVFDGGQYVLSCTSGDAADAFPIYTSPDQVSWTLVGHILPSAAKPAWAASDFWAPEIHQVGSAWVAYFSARDATTTQLSIGAAYAGSSTGPFTALTAPLVQQTGMGLIDASEFTDTDGTPYLLWKEDGNAIGKPTPIHAQTLTADGMALAGSDEATLITNDQAWEGTVTEAPWLIRHDGTYTLFYSGNSYANATYALGIAQASSPLGPFTKASGPIVVTGGAWVGPGHCSVLDETDGTYVIYHAWQVGKVDGPGDGRMVLVDRVEWGSDGWPTVPGAPSAATRPLP
jgi:GH43 family beta-xylosidase